jgi:hypothetical protein
MEYGEVRSVVARRVKIATQRLPGGVETTQNEVPGTCLEGNSLLAERAENGPACTHKSRTPKALAISPLPLEADIRTAVQHVRFVPDADSCTATR